ncbi:hypothetical protein [Rhodoferax sp.]|uniref:hypothetical protein n=1 Tax=Rhodoferax sp. TaxID=50421 RepID=UPI00284BA62F|nr:hypothetical protein [Rhodoferax sp.]MDR3369482.1 hypothetical protein [Rhodoferax sp.]
MPKVFGKKRIAEPALKSQWPIWLRTLFETLRDIPWLPLTAIGTLLGVSLLWTYFQSIDYFPTDLPALISLGVATAVCAFCWYALLAVGLFAPAVMYRQYRVDDKVVQNKLERAFSPLELLGLQFGSVGMLFGWLAYKDYRDCSGLSIGYGVIGAVSLLLFAVALSKIVWARGTVGQRLERLYVCVGIAAFGAFIALIFLLPLPVLKTEYFDFSILFFVFWGLAMLANAVLAERLPVAALVFVGAFAVLISFIVIPALVGKPSLFPQMVASTMGVRHDRAQEFRVPAKTCQLIQSGLGTQHAPSLSCSSGDWSAVKMQVLSNVGEQWLVEIQMNAARNSVETSFRMTIPKADVHLVQSPGGRGSKHVAMACGE